MSIAKTPSGRAYLHIWREGTAYEISNKLSLYKEWNNVRFTLLPHPPEAGIHQRDIRQPLPFPDQVFDAVYANHVLEHLTPAEGSRFVGELLRMLKPGGICRIVVPDLESTCREYLDCLATGLSDPSEQNLKRYRFAVLALIDQMVRDDSGGLLLELLKRGDFDVEQVRRRSGDVFEKYFPPRQPEPTLLQKIRTHSPRLLAYEILRRAKLALIRNDPRKTREANKWMYDRLSLRHLLEQAGFNQFSVRSHGDSEIPDWDRYNFDKSNRGDYPIEPSQYVEARKPLQQGNSTHNSP